MNLFPLYFSENSNSAQTRVHRSTATPWERPARRRSDGWQQESLGGDGTPGSASAAKARRWGHGAFDLRPRRRTNDSLLAQYNTQKIGFLWGSIWSENAFEHFTTLPCVSLLPCTMTDSLRIILDNTHQSPFTLFVVVYIIRHHWVYVLTISWSCIYYSSA